MSRYYSTRWWCISWLFGAFFFLAAPTTLGQLGEPTEWNADQGMLHELGWAIHIYTRQSIARQRITPFPHPQPPHCSQTPRHPGCFIRDGCHVQPAGGSFTSNVTTSDAINCCHRCRSFYPLYGSLQLATTTWCLGWSFESTTSTCSMLRFNCSAPRVNCTANIATILSSGSFERSSDSVCGFPMAGAVEIGMRFVPNNVTAVERPEITSPYMCQSTCNVQSTACAAWVFDMATSNCTLIPWNSRHRNSEVNFTTEPDVLSGFSNTLVPRADVPESDPGCMCAGWGFDY